MIQTQVFYYLIHIEFIMNLAFISIVGKDIEILDKLVANYHNLGNIFVMKIWNV